MQFFLQHDGERFRAYLDEVGIPVPMPTLDVLDIVRFADLQSASDPETSLNLDNLWKDQCLLLKNSGVHRRSFAVWSMTATILSDDAEWTAVALTLLISAVSTHPFNK